MLAYVRHLFATCFIRELRKLRGTKSGRGPMGGSVVSDDTASLQCLQSSDVLIYGRPTAKHDCHYPDIPRPVCHLIGHCYSPLPFIREHRRRCHHTCLEQSTAVASAWHFILFSVVMCGTDPRIYSIRCSHIYCISRFICRRNSHEPQTARNSHQMKSYVFRNSDILL